MGGIKGLLGDAPYPESPGFKEPTTSRDAAAAIKGRCGLLQTRCLAEFFKAGVAGLTADEVAERLGESVLAIRPRISELAKVRPSKIMRTGERRPNASGVKAAVWCIAMPYPQRSYPA